MLEGTKAFEKAAQIYTIGQKGYPFLANNLIFQRGMCFYAIDAGNVAGNVFTKQFGPKYGLNQFNNALLALESFVGKHTFEISKHRT